VNKGRESERNREGASDYETVRASSTFHKWRRPSLIEDAGARIEFSGVNVTFQSVRDLRLPPQRT
jgi:hypothetical protein